MNSHQPQVNTSVSVAIAEADDPCAVVEEAIPSLVIGDLPDQDEHAIADHCHRCQECAEVLDTWQTGFREPEAPTSPLVTSPATALGMREGNYGIIESPLGDLLVAVTDDGVAEVSYLSNHDREEVLTELEHRGILATERMTQVGPVRDQLREYFDHQRTTFALPVDLYGVTPFTRQVLEFTNAVPFGQVQTYQGVAKGIGKPGASRAVGNALGRNPIPIIVPCHRVVRADGTMGWYTGGPHIKQHLLGIEGVSFPQRQGKQRHLPGLG